jgi:hypothetical protein
MSIDLTSQKLKTIPIFWRNENIHINCAWNKIRSLKNCNVGSTSLLEKENQKNVNTLLLNFSGKVGSIDCSRNKIKSVKQGLIGIYSFRDYNKIKDNSYLDLVSGRTNKYLYLCHRKFRMKFEYKPANI